MQVMMRQQRFIATPVFTDLQAAHHRRRRARRRRRRLALGLTAVTGVGLAAAGITAVYAQTPQQERAEMNPVEALGIAVAGLGRLTLSLTAATAVGLMYRRLFAEWQGRYDTVEYKEARSKVHGRAAQWLLWLARVQGGIYVKAAQHIASLSYVVPTEYITALSVLQDRAPFRSWDIMRRVVMSELQIHDLEDAFVTFETVPVAAASLAQVHRATTIDGREVAVKIQYPDVRRLFGVDTATLMLLSSVAAWLFPGDFNLTWLAAEFKMSLSKEFDFENEARNSDLTSLRFARWGGDVACPAIRWDLTRRRILVMQFIGDTANGFKAAKVNDHAAIRAMGLDPRAVAKLLVECFSEMVFVHGIVHCDPHPGNMFVVPRIRQPTLFYPWTTITPQLVLLDHGLYRTLDDTFRTLYCDLWTAIVTHDTNRLVSVATALGIAPQHATVFPLLLTGRPAGSVAPLGSEVSAEERKRIRSEFKDVTVAGLVEFLERLPRDMLFAFRVGNLIRGIHRELYVASEEGGANVRGVVSRANAERLGINARYAVKGSHSISIIRRESRLAPLADAICSVSRSRFHRVDYYNQSNNNGFARGGWELSIFNPFAVFTDVDLKRWPSLAIDFASVSLRLAVANIVLWMKLVNSGGSGTGNGQPAVAAALRT